MDYDVFEDEDSIEEASLVAAVESVDSVEDVDNAVIEESDDDDDKDSTEETTTALDIEVDDREPDVYVETTTTSLFGKKSEGKYIVRAFTNAFLRTECNIKVESSKTVCRFVYEDEEYLGIVLKKIDSDNYIFLVEKSYNGKSRNEQKKYKKVYIPEAELIYAKPIF